MSANTSPSGAAAHLDEVDRRIVEFIQQFHTREGHAPSLEEIGHHLGMTKQGARWRINALVAAGFVDRQPGQPRTLSVIRTH